MQKEIRIADETIFKAQHSFKIQSVRSKFIRDGEKSILWISDNQKKLPFSISEGFAIQADSTHIYVGNLEWSDSMPVVTNNLNLDREQTRFCVVGGSGIGIADIRIGRIEQLNFFLKTNPVLIGYRKGINNVMTLTSPKSPWITIPDDSCLL